MDSRTGHTLTERQCNNGIFIWDIKNPLYFGLVRMIDTTGSSSSRMIHFQLRFNSNLRRQLNIHKCYLNFKIWTSLTPSVGGFLKRLKFYVFQFLESRHVISINNVLLAVDAFIRKYDAYIFNVTEEHDIKLNL